MLLDGHCGPGLSDGRSLRRETLRIDFYTAVAEQALCFMAGANSIFAGDKLLTTPNPSFDEDSVMFQLLGLKPREAFKEEIKELATENV